MGAGSSLPPGHRLESGVNRDAATTNQLEVQAEGSRSSGNAVSNMELTTISHLAAANQQLAAAHNLTLGHLHWFFTQQHNKQPTFTSNAANKPKTTKTTCFNCRGKTRLVVGKPRTRSTRKLRRHSAFDESRDGVDFSGTDRDVESSSRQEIREDSEIRTKNDRLASDLEEQRLLVERLTQRFKDSEKECKSKDVRLEEMLLKLRNSELESSRLRAELETFQNDRQMKEKEEKEVVEGVTHHEQQEEQEERRQETASSTAADQELFRKELMLKREMRQRAIAAISAEIDRLRCELRSEKAAHEETTKLLEEERAKKTDCTADPDKTDGGTSKRLEAMRLSQLLKVSDEVTNELWLQLERTDDLRFQLENEPDEHRLRIASLKRLAEEIRATLRSRKLQVNQLKDRLAQLVVHLGDRCLPEDTDDIKEEAERQIEDIARSRSLSDERSRILAELKDHCFKQIHELKVKLNNSRKDNLILEEDLRKTEDKMDAQDADILNLESQLGLAKADCRDLQNQMSLINSLFTQMLLSASSAEMDLDRLTQLLQENHDLISDVAKENGTEAAALPKLLLDIIEQVDGRTRESPEKKDDIQGESIAHNLPKVWRVLLELISCHAASGAANSQASEAVTPVASAPDSCYKSVDTPTGPRLVISVSKTYIRLKDLILEKKHLEKEMNRMKQLNTHLETKLSEQEKRLSTVSDELSKTWNIVGRMQVQHQQLHTHEKILRYELQQKRKMLQELKQELEYCREKWESARQKNSKTEIEWRSLRREFAARKALNTHQDSFNNSGESGFSDEQGEESDDDDDDEDLGKRVRPINSRRRSKKDESRAITPDTESEQPTDTEISECKTTSSSGSGLRTPSPETEAELENCECVEDDSAAKNVPTPDNTEEEEEEFDPLAKALSSCIENIIESTGNNCQKSCPSENCENNKIESIGDKTNLVEVTSFKEEKNLEISIDEMNYKSIENIETPSVPIVSVFSIGPFPTQPSSPVKNVQFSNPLVVGPSNKTTEKLPDVADSLPILEEEISRIAPSCSEQKEEHESTQTEKHCPKVIESSKKDMDSVAGSSSIPDTITAHVRKGPEKSPSEVLDARAARLRNLEEQAQLLVRRVNATNRRGSALNSRLEELHETYGSTPAAPPMPDVLPVFRLQTAVNDTENSEQDSKTS